MDARLGIVGIVTRDMLASLAFYRRFGLDVPEWRKTNPTPRRRP